MKDEQRAPLGKSKEPGESNRLQRKLPPGFCSCWRVSIRRGFVMKISYYSREYENSFKESFVKIDWK